MPTVTVPLPTPYAARIERGALAGAGALALASLAAGGRAVVVTSPAIRRHWGAPLEASLAAAGLKYTVLEMPDGERFKTLATLEALALQMVAAGLDRDTLLIALGGGVVGDVAAFLASVYMRGIDVIHIPTTLVAMIDSALGGKTGVNLATGKNLVGTFHHPRAILVDPDLLATLPEREYRSGLAEAIKYGIIGDPELFAFLEKRAPAAADTDALEWLIAACLRQKAAVVAADEREGDLRRILNFGHTLGHALESATEYCQFLHGEAVAWGMIAACHIAERQRRLEPAVAARIRAAILALCGPVPPVAVPPATLLAHAARDKKTRAGVLHFVLPTAIGKVEIVRNVPSDVVLAACAAASASAR